jgi:hypothetical protein
MAEMTQVEGAPRAQGLLSRIVGIVLSPRETFASVAAHPKVFGVLAFITLTACLTIGGLLLTGPGQQAWLDQQVEQSQAWGGDVSDEQYAQLQKIAPIVGYITIGIMLVAIPIVTLISAGILFAVFNAAMGGRATFKQLFAVVAHAGVISALGWIFVMPLNYLRETMSSPTNLAALAPGLDEGNFIVHLLGTIDLFLIWWVVVLGIGLAVLYRRRTQPIVISLLGVYAVIGLIIAVSKSAMGGS